MINKVYVLIDEITGEVLSRVYNKDYTSSNTHIECDADMFDDNKSYMYLNGEFIEVKPDNNLKLQHKKAYIKEFFATSNITNKPVIYEGNTFYGGYDSASILFNKIKMEEILGNDVLEFTTIDNKIITLNIKDASVLAASILKSYEDDRKIKKQILSNIDAILTDELLSDYINSINSLFGIKLEI